LFYILWFNVVHYSSLFYLLIYYSPYSSWKFVYCNIKWSRDLNKSTEIRNHDVITAPLYEKALHWHITWYHPNALLHSRAGVQLSAIKISLKVGVPFASIVNFHPSNQAMKTHDQNIPLPHFLVRFLIACDCTCACTDGRSATLHLGCYVVQCQSWDFLPELCCSTTWFLVSLLLFLRYLA